MTTRESEVFNLISQLLRSLRGSLTFFKLKNPTEIMTFSFSPDGCWGTLIANTFQRRADVIQRGFSGYNTRLCLAALPFLPQISDISVVTIFLGANDAAEADGRPSQHVPINEYKENLKAICHSFENAGAQNVVFITPPPVDIEAWSVACVARGFRSSRKKARTAEYAVACMQTSVEIGHPVIDLHSEMLKCSDWKNMLADGLHLSTKGASFLASLVIPELEKYMPQGILLPMWLDVNPEFPNEDFVKWVNDNCFVKN